MSPEEWAWIQETWGLPLFEDLMAGGEAKILNVSDTKVAKTG